MKNDKNEKLNQVGANLAAAFGYSNKEITRQITSRQTSVNITLFDGEGLNSVGQPLAALTFNEAAKMMRKDEIEGTDKDFDRMLARRNGVRLKNGKVLKDNWAKGLSIPTTYDD